MLPYIPYKDPILWVIEQAFRDSTSNGGHHEMKEGWEKPPQRLRDGYKRPPWVGLLKQPTASWLSYLIEIWAKRLWYHMLVGGFNPSEKYYSQNSIYKNKKCSKPPTSMISMMHDNHWHPMWSWWPPDCQAHSSLRQSALCHDLCWTAWGRWEG